MSDVENVSVSEKEMVEVRESKLTVTTGNRDDLRCIDQRMGKKKMSISNRPTWSTVLGDDERLSERCCCSEC